MNKDLDKVLKEVGNELCARTFCWKVDSFINYSQSDVSSLLKYRDYTIARIIELTRIERLFDLNLISLQDKKTLLKEYKEYKELSSIIIGFELDQFTGKISKDEKLDEKVCLREKELENKLKSFGILEDFDYKEAIINEIDKKLILKKSK